MIKAYSSMQPLTDLGRIRATSKIIRHEKSLTSQQIYKLKWLPLGQGDGDSFKAYAPAVVSYTVYYTEDLRVNLASVCVVNGDVAKAHGLLRQQSSTTSKDVGFMPGKTYNINIIASILSGPDKGTVYPYLPFRLELPKLKANNSMSPE